MVPALSKHKKIVGELLSSAFIIRMLGALTSFFFINIYIFFAIKDEVLQQMLMSLSLILLFNEPFGVITNYCQSRINMKGIVLARCVSLGVRTIFVLVSFKLLDNKLIYFSRAAESISLAIILTILFLSYKIKIKLSKKIILIIFKRGISFWLPLICMMIYFRVDRYFVEKYFSYDTLAMYGVAVQFIEQAFLLIVIIIQSISPRYIFPILSKRDLIENIKKITLILFLVVIFMQVFSYLFLPFIITLVFGHEYFNAGQIAVTLLPSLLFYAIDSILMQVLYKDKNAIAILFKWLSMMMISCSLYYVWYGLLSEMNMAMIFNINYVIMTAITFLFVKKGLKVRDYD